ncbi:MAG TPA: hypothetical protein EYP67_06350 [Methanosarcinales archaeon]|nr:hypothetical protein [Methanosarcinales archaeon]
MNCVHESCGNGDKVWLPFEIEGLNKGLKPHPYCVRCGIVKNISSDRARNIGYYINVLARMGRRTGCVTNVQMRLIVKELEGIDGFADIYSTTGNAQKNLFMDVVKKYCNLSEHLISSMLRSELTL